MRTQALDARAQQERSRPVPPAGQLLRKRRTASCAVAGTARLSEPFASACSGLGSSSPPPVPLGHASFQGGLDGRYTILALCYLKDGREERCGSRARGRRDPTSLTLPISHTDQTALHKGFEIEARGLPCRHHPIETRSLSINHAGGGRCGPLATEALTRATRPLLVGRASQFAITCALARRFAGSMIYSGDLYLAISALPTTMWCTSSGPSAKRRVRWTTYMSANGVHCESPVAPWI
jgi:hypothetical protein